MSSSSYTVTLPLVPRSNKAVSLEGVNYQTGRLSTSATQTLGARGTDNLQVAQGVIGHFGLGTSFNVKLMAPLDNSDDARGGMGRVAPATLVLHDQECALVRLVADSERGHTALLRAVAGRPKEQVILKASLTLDAGSTPEILASEEAEEGFWVNAKRRASAYFSSQSQSQGQETQVERVVIVIELDEASKPPQNAW